MNVNGGARTPDGEEETTGRTDNESPPSVTLQQRRLQEQRTPPTPDVRLYHRAVVVAQEATGALHTASLSIDPEPRIIDLVSRCPWCR